MNEKILGTENISKLYFKYTIPAVISMVLAGSQTLIGGMILGNFIGPNALAVVNLVNPFIQLSMAISMIIAFGSLSIIGRNLGSGNYKTGQNTFKTGLILISVFAIVYGLVGIFYAKEISNLLGADSELMEGVIIYLKTSSFFLIFYPLMILTGFVDRVVGKPELYLYGTITTFVVNTTLGFIFVKYLGLGIRGAALATGLSFMMGFIVTVRPMFNKKHTINLFVGHFDKNTVVPMLYNGASEGIGAAATALAIYLFNIEFMRRVGPSGVAAFTTVSFVVNFGTLMIFGIADGISPIVSYNFGHQNFDRVKAIMRKGVINGFVIGCGVFLVLYIGGEKLASLFAKGDAEVIKIATSGSKVYAFAFLVNSFNIIYSIYFTAIGGAKQSAMIAVSRGIIWITLGIQLWPMYFGMTGVWLSIPVAEVMTLILVIYLLKVYTVEKFEVLAAVN